MIFQGQKILNASFDIYADNYHNVRPGYPRQMYDDIKQFCDINKDSQLLEVGSGSGIATAELAKFGCSVTAIEPGKNLVKIAKEETSTNRNVKIVNSIFEEYQSTEKFDAILFLTAFHWIKEGARYQKVFELLENNGSLVLVWNSFFQSNSPAMEEINLVYKEILPDIYCYGVNSVNENVLDKLNKREKEIHENDLFYMYFLRKYITVYNYNPDTYHKLLNTFPKVIKLEEKRRNNFLSRIAKIVKKFGNISVPVLTTLIICKRKNFFIKLIGQV